MPVKSSRSVPKEEKKPTLPQHDYAPMSPRHDLGNLSITCQCIQVSQLFYFRTFSRLTVTLYLLGRHPVCSHTRPPNIHQRLSNNPNTIIFYLRHALPKLSAFED